jgi:LacI family transcriptional regulator
MAKARITIKELANRMNLSTSTISRALNNHPSIGEKTTMEVKKLASELGYFPNATATNLRRNKTFSIGVIVPKIDIHFHSRAISGIEEVAYKSGYHVSIYQSNNSLEREIAITSILQARMVEGIIACLSLETHNTDHFDVFKRLEVPIVYFDRTPINTDTNKVIIDDFAAAFKATEHLVLLGRKNIAHIAGNQSAEIFKDRFEGYKAALTKNKLPIRKELIVCAGKLSYMEGLEAAKKLLSQKIAIDGLFCANDYSAISAIQTFIKNKHRVPEDIAVVGFSNYPVSEIIEPTLTTIDDSAYEMGKAAAKLLLRHMKEEDPIVVSETIVIRTKLIERHSTINRQTE